MKRGGGGNRTREWSQHEIMDLKGVLFFPDDVHPTEIEFTDL